MITKYSISIFAVFLLCSVFCGCDQIYRILQKEGAQERDLIGDLVPFESNERVQEVQRLLKLYGYRVGKVDGKLGPNTRTSIKRFQENNGLEVTRFVDEATWEKLNYFGESGLVVNGEVNIKVVQKALHNAGFNPGKIDGKMGPQSTRALQKFQKAMSLQPDGTVGFRTLKELHDFLPSP